MADQRVGHPSADASDPCQHQDVKRQSCTGYTHHEWCRDCGAMRYAFAAGRWTQWHVSRSRAKSRPFDTNDRVRLNHGPTGRVVESKWNPDSGEGRGGWLVTLRLGTGELYTALASELARLDVQRCATCGETEHVFLQTERGVICSVCHDSSQRVAPPKGGATPYAPMGVIDAPAADRVGEREDGSAVGRNARAAFVLAASLRAIGDEDAAGIVERLAKDVTRMMRDGKGHGR